MVKIQPSNAGGTSLIPGQGAKISHGSWPENQRAQHRSGIITNWVSREVQERGDIHVFMADSLCYVAETSTTL